MATFYAQAKLPKEAARVFSQGTLTALLKTNGKVRDITAGESLRRLVARTLFKHYGDEVKEACKPYQYALSIRAGTECVAHLLQAFLEADPANTMLLLDGIGAYDLMRRRAMLSKPTSRGSTRALLPFVRMSYGAFSVYSWLDDEGREHLIHQSAGGEQGDPQMPALFFLGQHEVLEAVRRQLLDSEHFFAFLDDLYVHCKPERARAVLTYCKENCEHTLA